MINYLIDSHCHLDFSDFDADRESIIAECKNNNIKTLVIPGVSPDKAERSFKIFSHFFEMKFALGLHPWWINKWVDKHYGLDIGGLESRLNNLCGLYPYVAIGECGLDKAISTEMDMQVEVFKTHIWVANKQQLPLIIHSRKAHSNILELLKNQPLKKMSIVHGFVGSIDVAREYWSHGCYLGIGGSITYKRASKTRDAVRKMPLESLVLETDSPDMPLQGQQGKRNSPVNVIKVAKCLAELRNEPYETIVEQTTKNAEAIFNLF